MADEFTYPGSAPIRGISKNRAARGQNLCSCDWRDEVP
jgi:hypothetical protein